MKNDPSFTRGGKRFRGNIEDNEKPWVRDRAETPGRFRKDHREPSTLLLDSSTQTTSPLEHDTLVVSSQGGLVRTLQTPGGG